MSAGSADDDHRARITPCPAASTRPLWSVMIPTHECGEHLAEALRSVLEQDPGPEEMQITVVDDHSTRDDPERTVRRVAGDRVEFIRQPRNVGHVRNFETCLRTARGHLVHQLHGDDKVLHGFYRRMARPFSQEPTIGAAFCRHVIMDAAGHWVAISDLERSTPGVLERWLERIAVGQRLKTPAIVVRREVYERLGGFDRRLRWLEDWEMWVRIAAAFPVWYEPEPLAAYRVHPSSSSSRLARTGADILDLKTAVRINREVLPAGLADSVSSAALKAGALAAVRRARRHVRAGDLATAEAQLRAALACSRRPGVLRRAAPVAMVLALARARRLTRKSPR